MGNLLPLNISIDQRGADSQKAGCRLHVHGAFEFNRPFIRKFQRISDYSRVPEGRCSWIHKKCDPIKMPAPNSPRPDSRPTQSQRIRADLVWARWTSSTNAAAFR